jgi:hypothetical protein
MLLGPLGNINLPPDIDTGYGDLFNPGGGLVGFLNNIFKLITVAAGLFAIINFILAGYGIMSSSGDPEKLSKAQNKIWFSIIGLVVIVASFTIAALLGWILFKDTNAILNIKIFGPGPE